MSVDCNLKEKATYVQGPLTADDASKENSFSSSILRDHNLLWPRGAKVVLPNLGPKAGTSVEVLNRGDEAGVRGCSKGSAFGITSGPVSQ